MLFNNKTLNPL